MAGMTGLQTLDLLGSGWKLESMDGKHVVEHASLPGQALQMLHDAGLVDDPLHGYNDLEYRWAAEATWVLTKQFEMPDEIMALPSVELLLSGVDTFADVFINGENISEQCPTTDNAHREYRFAVKHLLVAHDNEIRVVLHPATAEMARRSAAYPYPVPVMQGPGYMGPYNYIRKPACDFGWDWGPAFAPAGIVGDVQLIGSCGAYLTGCNIRQEHSADGTVQLTIDCVLRTPRGCGRQSRELTAELQLDEVSLQCGISVNISADVGEHVETLKMTVAPGTYDLWWPAGYEQRRRYTVSVTARTSQHEDSQLAQQHSLLRRCIGFRTVRLVREPLRALPLADAETFYFEINGVPTYMRGAPWGPKGSRSANIIPLDVFRSRVTPERERQMVKGAVGVNMNMLRVWGGGAYPTDTFLDECDERGILVWLEVMCACALYPRDDAFLQSMHEEVRQQARRLNWHPCVCIWGGNNEVEASMQWFPESRSPDGGVSPLYAVDYDALFCQTIRRALEEVDPRVLYLDSSPSNGLVCSEPYVKRWGDVQSPHHGDVHFYDYASDALDPATYPRAKFVSEFGYQSFPSSNVWEAAIAESEDIGWDSAMSEHRQRHPNGNAELLAQLKRHFRLGCALERSRTGFRRWTYLTQVQQAMVYEAAITHWRRLKHDTHARTMGVLYWQLNDVWQGPSWSSLNCDGTWKLLMFAARRFFSPLLASGTVDRAKGTLSLFLTSDVPADLAGSVMVETIAWRDTAPMWSCNDHFELRQLGGMKLWTRRLSDLLGERKLQLEDVFFRISVAADADHPAASNVTSRTIESSAVVFPTELKDAQMQDPHLHASEFLQAGGQSVMFKLTCTVPAVFVSLDSSIAGDFSRSCIAMVPWQHERVVFMAKDDVSIADLKRTLRMQSLFTPQ